MQEIWKLVLKLAKKAYKRGEIPVGAVITYNNKIIGKGYNTREKSKNILGHAEIMAIKQASKVMKSWKLDDCTLYVNLKPCSMCESVIKQSRISKVYYLVDKSKEKKEFYKTNFETFKDQNLNLECKKMLKDFFQNLRQ